jgi:hypothetical protein
VRSAAPRFAALALVTSVAGCENETRLPQAAKPVPDVSTHYARTAHPRATQRWCHQLPRFTAYYAGNRVNGLPATSAEVSCERRYEDEGPSGYVDFGYGSCNASSEEEGGGCTLPFDIQSAPLCSRHPALYTTPDGQIKPDGRLRIRGVPAAWYEGKSRLELYTRRTTIIVFGDHPRSIRRVALRLHKVPRYNLPPRSGKDRSHFRHDPPRATPRHFKPASKRALREKKECG